MVAAALSLVVVGGLIYASFLDWRARHQELVAYGREQVAPTVAPLVDIKPPGVPAEDWQQAVADTRALIEALTAAGVLDRPRMEALKAELEAKVAAATPETAVATLRALWDDLERRAGPVLNREFLRPPQPPTRPAILQAKPPAPR